MSKKYIFIDSNIYIFCATLTKDDKYSSELIEKLTSVLNDDKDIILLVPEIVKFEYERVSRDILKTKQENINKLDSDIEKGSSGISDFEKKKISTLLKDIMKNTQENHKKVSSSLEKIFNSKTTYLIEVTPQILTNAYKRAIAGKKPFSIKNVDKGNLHNPINADCVIFETILNFFTVNKIQKGDKLFFCTDNTSDFTNGEENLLSELTKELNIEVKFYSNFPKMIKEGFKKEISQETIKEYQHLTEFATKSEGIQLTPNLYTIAFTPNQLGALHGLGVDLSGGRTFISQAVNPNINIGLGRALEQNNIFSGATINPAGILSGALSAHGGGSLLLNNKQKCITCSAVFERSITDYMIYDKCLRCRGIINLGGN